MGRTITNSVLLTKLVLMVLSVYPRLDPAGVAERVLADAGEALKDSQPLREALASLLGGSEAASGGRVVPIGEKSEALLSTLCAIARQQPLVLTVEGELHWSHEMPSPELFFV